MQEIINGIVFVLMCVTLYCGYFYIKDYFHYSHDKELLAIGIGITILSFCGMYVAIYGMAGVELAI